MPKSEYLTTQFYKRLKKTYIRFNYVSLDAIINSNFIHERKINEEFIPIKQKNIVKNNNIPDID
ncbi:hypothetical protein GCM10007987_00310 [Aliivibrio fischeri]|nr:hypothetical protein GCM10007987_00310 [Aliivibrio fischeri]